MTTWWSLSQRIRLKRRLMEMEMAMMMTMTQMKTSTAFSSRAPINHQPTLRCKVMMTISMSQVVTEVNWMITVAAMTMMMCFPTMMTLNILVLKAPQITAQSMSFH